MDENASPTPPPTPLPPPAPVSPPTGSDPAPKNKDDNMLGVVCHLLGFAGLIIPFGGNVIGPLVLWLVKRAESPYLDVVGKEVVNFNISWTIYAAIAFLSVFAFIGFLILPVVGIAWLVLTIIGAIKASEGKLYRYPLTIRMIK